MKWRPPVPAMVLGRPSCGGGLWQGHRGSNEKQLRPPKGQGNGVKPYVCDWNEPTKRAVRTRLQPEPWIDTAWRAAIKGPRNLFRIKPRMGRPFLVFQGRPNLAR